MRCAVWIAFIWRFQHHYAAELLPRAQGLEKDAKIPITQTISNEQKTRGGKRLLDDLRQKVWFRGHVGEERQIIVFGQDERLRDIERAVQMEHKRIGWCWFVARFFFKNRFDVLQNILPATDFATRIFQFPF